MWNAREVSVLGAWWLNFPGSELFCQWLPAEAVTSLDRAEMLGSFAASVCVKLYLSSISTAMPHDQCTWGPLGGWLSNSVCLH